MMASELDVYAPPVARWKKWQRHELAMSGYDFSYIGHLVVERRIPYISFGHLLRFDPVDVDAWVDRARVGECRPPSGPDRRRSQ